MKRVCINFSTQCNMHCDFCYNFFDNKEFDLNICISVINKCIDMGFEIFSIGGGDPFTCYKIWDVINYLQYRNKIIQIDTNGLALGIDDLILLNRYIKIISFPIDGSNELTHCKVRNNSEHYNKIITLLDFISKNNFQYKVKINTLLSKVNISYVFNIGNMLENFKVNIWSIYEFWPLGDAIKVIDKYIINDTLLKRTYSELAKIKYKNKMDIELDNYKSRYQTYLFITPQGLMYINDMNNINKYKIIGSIFDEEAVKIIKNLNISTIRNDIKKRYI